MAQPIAEATLDILREAAEVTVYPYLDRQITADELAANARRHDWLFLASDNIITAEILDELCRYARAGVTTLELDLLSRKLHARAGATPASRESKQ